MTYVNPTASVAGRLTLSNAGQRLTVASSTCSALGLTTGDAMSFTDGAGASAVFTVTIPAALASQPRVWI
jgi:hypothetical protein